MPWPGPPELRRDPSVLSYSPGCSFSASSFGLLRNGPFWQLRNSVVDARSPRLLTLPCLPGRLAHHADALSLSQITAETRAWGSSSRPALTERLLCPRLQGRAGRSGSFWKVCFAAGGQDWSNQRNWRGQRSRLLGGICQGVKGKG